MKIFKLHKSVILMSIPFLAIMIVACNDNPADGGEEYSNLKELRIVVTENSTSTPLAGVDLIMDGRSELSCVTPDPSGECIFMMKTGRHSIVLSKNTFTTIETEFDFTSSMTVKYFGLRKSGY
ncbi:MAG: hypothetical protein GY841_07525 [FCB group bacterium]|nr:hypothetical protein [FCB group bacterium]